jgi:hypothetical protein
MPRARILAVLVASAISVMGVVAVSTLSRSPLPTRHTVSSGSSLVTLDTDSSVWARVTYTREVWIAPDGSGRIVEHNEPLGFPSETEQREWLAAGSPMITPVSQSFERGGLVYLLLDTVPRDPAAIASQLTADGPTSTQVLRRVVLLLNETVPPLDLTEAVVSALRRIPGIAVDDRGTVVMVSGTDEGAVGSVKTSLLIDLRTGQLVSEKRVATNAIPGLTAEPPIVMLERTIELTELSNE